MRRGTAIAVLYDVLIDARYQVEKDAINMAIEALSEPSGDLISRQAAIRWVKTECNPYGKATLDFESGKKVIEHLKQMPSAEPKTGKWICKGDYAVCSECGGLSGTQFDGVEPIPLKTNFCQNCGADMRGEET